MFDDTGGYRLVAVKHQRSSVRSSATSILLARNDTEQIVSLRSGNPRNSTKNLKVKMFEEISTNCENILGNRQVISHEIPNVQWESPQVSALNT